MGQAREANLTLFAKVDDATIQRAIKRFGELSSAQKDVKKASDWAYEGMSQELRGLPPLNAELQKKIANLRKEFYLAEQRAKAFEKSAKLIDRETEAIKENTQASKENVRASEKQQQTKSDAGRKQLTAIAGGTSALGGLESLAGAGPAGDILRSISAIARLKTQIDMFAEASESAAGSAGQAASGMTGIGGSLAGLAAAGIAAVALAAMSIAIAKFIEDINRYQQTLSTAADAQVKYYELIQSGTEEEIQAEMKRIEVKRNSIEWARRDAEAGRKATEAWSGFSGVIARLLGILGITTKTEKEYADQLAEINAQYDAYSRALKSQEVQQRRVEQATQNSADALKAATAAENARTKAVEEAKRKEEERAKAIQQAAQEIAQARMREKQAEAEANKRQIQKLVDIARGFAQASADALRKLKADEAAMAEKFGQEQVDIITDAQREEVQAAREHVRNIAAIQKRARRDEFEASLSLDFARIAQIRREAAQEIEETSERFAAEREEANIALKQRLQDAAVAFQRERAARLQDYKNQLVDLRISRARQQEEARIAHQREIANLRQRLQDEINLKNSALQATLAATRAWANAMRAAVGGGGTVARRASGGPLSAFQTAIVNERAGQRESFVSGGTSVMLPAGMGVFTPFRAGSVSNQTNMGGVAINIYESRNPRETQAMIDRAIKRLVQ